MVCFLWWSTCSFLGSVVLLKKEKPFGCLVFLAKPKRERETGGFLVVWKMCLDGSGDAYAGELPVLEWFWFCLPSVRLLLRHEPDVNQCFIMPQECIDALVLPSSWFATASM